MTYMRQYVFAPMERGGKRGYADITPEVELDEGGNLPIEVVALEGELTSANPDESHRRSRRQMGYKTSRAVPIGWHPRLLHGVKNFREEQSVAV